MRKATIGHTWERDEIAYDFEIVGTISQGDPGCRYTRNGDGWPPEPPHVEDLSVELVAIHVNGGKITKFGPVTQMVIEATFNDVLARDKQLMRSIEDALLQAADGAPDDSDFRYELARERE